MDQVQPGKWSEDTNAVMEGVDGQWTLGDRRQAHYVANVLRNHHRITNREQIRKRYDKETDYQDINGLGPRRGTLLAKLMRATDHDWLALTRLPLYGPEYTG